MRGPSVEREAYWREVMAAGWHCRLVCIIKQVGTTEGCHWEGSAAPVPKGQSAVRGESGC